MKKKNFLMTIATLILAMVANAQNFVLKGKVKGNVEGASVMLQKYTMDNVSNLDSTTIQNGTFTLKGDVKEPEQYQMVIDLNKPGTEQPDYQKIYTSRVYVENKPMTYDIDLTGFPDVANIDSINPIIKGSITQDTYQKFLNISNSFQAKADSISHLIEATQELARKVELTKETWKLQDDLQQATNNFIKQNASSLVAFDLVNEALSNLPCPYTEAQIDEMLSWIRTDWGNKPQFANLQTQADFAKHTAVGKPFIDGTFVTPKGNKVKLSSLIKKGEYTMLEFWASWCHPCRQEIPHLKKVHEKYKNFNIISVSVDERDADWKKAMASEGMTWTQLRNPEGFGGIVMGEYGINAIPACLILDKNGNFYKTEMRGDDLDAFLYDYYKR